MPACIAELSKWKFYTNKFFAVSCVKGSTKTNCLYLYVCADKGELVRILMSNCQPHPKPQSTHLLPSGIIFGPPGKLMLGIGFSYSNKQSCDPWVQSTDSWVHLRKFGYIFGTLWGRLWSKFRWGRVWWVETRFW